MTTAGRHDFLISVEQIAIALAALVYGMATKGQSQAPPPAPLTLFTNVRIFDGKGGALSAPSNVLVRGNKIEKISASPIPVEANLNVTVIAGGGRTLMPGLIDAHTHIMFATLPQAVTLTSDPGFIYVAATKAANDTLMRGFTSIRDVGGPAFIVAAIEAALEDVHPSLPPPNFAGTDWDGLAMIREMRQEWEEKEKRIFAEAFPASQRRFDRCFYRTF